MSVKGLMNIRKALSALNPKQVREMSERPVRVALHAGSQEAYQRMENFFLRDLSPARRRVSAGLLTRAPIPVLAQRYDLDIYDEGMVTTTEALVFRVDRTHHFVERRYKASRSRGSFSESFPSFPEAVESGLSRRIREKNALFSIATALPDVVPSIIELPWAVAEFASDTAFLTMNQVRMAFLIAAASDREVGYLEQKPEIAMVIGSAFGWRALARQLISKIPFGGGLVAKAAVAYAGTKVLGLSLDDSIALDLPTLARSGIACMPTLFGKGGKSLRRFWVFPPRSCGEVRRWKPGRETISVPRASQFQS